ncbi:hypothetical protein K2W90_01940 [Candidatus Babeliales bacterium]|nr:hypothetical protein [Candidatus Babeliales bacterium]
MKKILYVLFFLSLSTQSIAKTSENACETKAYLAAPTEHDDDRESGALWFHLENIDDLYSVMGLIIRLFGELPETEIFITTTLMQTKEIINYLFPKLHVHLIAQDNLQIIASLYNHLRPSAIILVKHEVVPSLVLLSLLQKTPIFLLNASASQATERLLSMSPYFYKELFNVLSGIFCQTKEDKVAFEKLGIKKPPTVVSGPLHLYNILQRKNYLLKKLKTNLQKNNQAFDYPVILMHSYNRNRIKLYLNAYEELQKELPQLKLILSTGCALSWEAELCTLIKNKNLDYVIWNNKLDQFGKKADFINNLANIFKTNNIFISCINGPLFFWNSIVPIFVCDENAADEENFLIFQAAIWKNAIIVGPFENLRQQQQVKPSNLFQIVGSKNELCSTLLQLLKDKEYFTKQSEASYRVAKKIMSHVTTVINPFFDSLKNHLQKKEAISLENLSSYESYQNILSCSSNFIK